jgi:uncharacterized protein
LQRAVFPVGERTSGVTAATGFHEGELALQRRAGVQHEAKRLEPMLARAELSGGTAKILALQGFLALTARDAAGVLWTSPLAGPPGFLQGHDEFLQISATLRDGDPLRGLVSGQPVGMIAMNFAARRRVRLNGVLVRADASGMVVHVEQSYGNCPQHIHPRAVDAATLTAPPRGKVRFARSLDSAAQQLVTRSDTFFLGTTHPTQGNDASHRGGSPGFVRMQSPSQLWWPDYPGNNMFNSFGNLAVDDEAALLFVDFETGGCLHLSGKAEVQWTRPGDDGDDGGVGRRVVFSIESVVAVGR